MVTPVEIPVAIDLASVVVGATFGSLLARRSEFDVVGVVALSILAGLGGGIVRDVLLDQVPVALTDRRYLPIAAAVALGMFILQPGARRLERLLTVIDAVMLGIFAVAGAAKALATGLDVPGAVFVGIVSSVAGGIACDVLTGRPPMVFRAGTLYAVAAALGSLVFVLGIDAGVDESIAVPGAAGLTIALRLLALRFGWAIPTPRGLMPVLVERRGRRRRRPRGRGRGTGE